LAATAAPALQHTAAAQSAGNMRDLLDRHVTTFTFMVFSSMTQ